MQNNISSNDYTYVENESSEFYGIKFRNDSPYSGVVVVYGTVSVKESVELDMATLSFTFNIQDAGPRNIDELESSEEFKNYLGDVLGTIISEENNGRIESAADARTESSSQ
jgi:hypothetical protein|tara:strand:- start:239 stop:571 length:333 start_codon:yes stop_codon:yes gene_type:complete